MAKILLILIIPAIILGGLGYWRFIASKPVSNLTTAQVDNQTSVEVPKTLPGASVEDRVKSLEDTVGKLATQVNNIKPSSSQAPVSGSLASRLTAVETALTDLKTRVAALEKATPVPAGTSTKYPLYIPLGSGGGPWGDKGWYSLNEYQAVINADNYSGYTSMQLEANFRLVEVSGTGSVRLYNVTDSSAVSPQLDTTANSFGTKTSGTFKLPAGQKTYTVQIKSSEGVSLFIQSARIKVNF